MSSPGFKEMRLPLEISAWMVGGPMWSTRTFSTQSGDESRVGLWDYPLHKFNIGNGLRMPNDAITTKRFQIRARGKLFGFRVLDHFDYQCRFAEGVLIPTSIPGYYQLAKVYTEDGDTFTRKIFKPIPGTCTVTKNGVAVADPINYTNGIAGLATSPGDVLAWAGLFDVPVRFESDWLEVGQDTGGLINWNSASIMEIRKIGTSIGTPPGAEFFAGGAIDTVIPGGGGGGSPGPTPPPAPSPATAVVVGSHPSAGLAGVASEVFHFSLDGLASAPVHVTLKAFGDSGEEVAAWSPAVITLNSAFDDITAVYTPASAGSKTLTRTNDGGLANGPNLSYNAFATRALTLAPTFSTAAPGVVSGDFTVGSNVPLLAATVVTPHSSGSGGSFTPSTVTIGPGHAASATFKRTAAATGTETISITNDQGVTNADAVTLSVQTPPSALTLSPSSMTSTAGSNSADFTATLDRAATAMLHVTLNTTGTGGNFEVGSGAYATSGNVLTFNPGDTSLPFRRNAATAGTETISLTNDAGLTNGSSATLTVNDVAAPPPSGGGGALSGGSGDTLLAGVPITGLSGASGDNLKYQFTLLRSADFRLQLSGGTGNADLGYGEGYDPGTASDGDDASEGPTNEEILDEYGGQGADIYTVVVSGISAFSGATLRLDVFEPSTQFNIAGGTKHFAATSGQGMMFTCNVNAGISTVTATIAGVDGMAYVAFGRLPSTTDYDSTVAVSSSGTDVAIGNAVGRHNLFFVPSATVADATLTGSAT